MLVHGPFSIEVPPLFNQQKGLLNDPLPMSLGPEIFFLSDGVGKDLVCRPVLYFKGDDV